MNSLGHMKKKIQAFWRNEDGIGTLEVLLIIAVVVVIFLLFRDFIMKYVNDIIAKTGSKINETLN